MWSVKLKWEKKEKKLKRFSKMPKNHRSTSTQWGWEKFFKIRSRSRAFSLSSSSVFFLEPFHRIAVFILITLVLLSQTSFLMLNSYYMFLSIYESSASRSAGFQVMKNYFATWLYVCEATGMNDNFICMSLRPLLRSYWISHIELYQHLMIMNGSELHTEA